MYRVMRSTRAVSRNELPACRRLASGTRHVLQRDLAVLDDFERDLVLDLLDAEAGRGLVLDDEAFDLIVSDIARPDDRDIAPRRIADPPLLTVEDPGVALALRRRQSGRRSCPEPTSGSVKPKQPIFSQRAIGGSHFCFCSSDPSRVDRAHGQAVVDAEERRDRGVDARQLHRDQPNSFWLPPAHPYPSCPGRRVAIP